MYLRWAEDQDNCKVNLLQEMRGEEAGIKSCTLKIVMDYSYGWLKKESGIHRLVRISPFDSNKRRHTSFASVWVYPIVSNNIAIEIESKDIRIDTYRASGAGGQHVNKTESAIRLTHVPTNTVVECQDGRSQHKNLEKAISVLRSRLYQQELDRLNNERAEQRKSLVSTGDRSAKIRTYNYPQGRITDHRINKTMYNLSSFMNGDVQEMIDALKVAENAEKLKGENL